jgi:hypothetical protein
MGVWRGSIFSQRPDIWEVCQNLVDIGIAFSSAKIKEV